MKLEIINERKRSSAIMPIFGLFCALFIAVLFGIFDIKELGANIEEGIETDMYIFVRIVCIIVLPLLIFNIIKNIKILIKGELYCKISSSGIYANISKENVYNIKYKDITKVTFKDYGKGVYILFIFLKNPDYYLSETQLKRMQETKIKFPEAGDVSIPSLIINEKIEVVLETINYYLKKENVD